MPLRLSVLDLSPIPAGASTRDALHNTLDLARHAESLGYARYWLAEHHNAASLACSAPEIMIGQIAAVTRTIRVGSGGVMLPNHSALKVAEVFRVLSALFPGRVDLGLGRAPGTDGRTAAALRRSPPGHDDFPGQLADLCGYLAERGGPRPSWPDDIIAIPAGAPEPDLWILGSTDSGAATAAERGLGFAFARQINPHEATEMMRSYRSAFRPSRYRRAPEAILALSVICAETGEEAERLASSMDLAGVRFAQGQRDLPLPTVEEALAHRYDPDEESLRALNRERHLVGSAAEVAERIKDLAGAAGADEVMVMSHVHDHQARRRVYTRLAQALG